MKQYHELMKHILENGKQKGDRTGTGTIGVFGYQMRFNLLDGFPMLTTKKLHWKSIAHELLWFLQGSTNIGYLKENGVRIWDEWALPNGELGPMYGKQWTNWEATDGRHINQIADVIEQIKSKPNSRRLIVSAWNPADLPDESLSPQTNVANGKMALAACHAFFQFQVEEMSFNDRFKSYMYSLTDEEKEILNTMEFALDQERINEFFDNLDIPRYKLNCQLYQRSADVFLGVPFNIASYALLMHMIADQCNLSVGDFVWTGGDVHLYNNTIEQAKIQLERTPKELPRLLIKRKADSVFDYRFEDFELFNYNPDPHIKAVVSV